MFFFNYIYVKKIRIRINASTFTYYLAKLNVEEYIMKIFLLDLRKVFLSIIVFLFLFSFVSGLLLIDNLEPIIPVIGQRLVPIYKVDRPDNRISITFDGTWGADYTEQILTILKEHEIKTTFFFAGYWLEKYPELVKKISSHGHQIENHTYTHPHCNSLSRNQLIKELEDTSNLIEDLTGRRPQYFRPPFGEYNNNVIRNSREAGYQVVQWSIDSLDWKEPGESFIVQRILSSISSGDIILMHNNAPDTPGALKKIIPVLKEKGFEIVPLSGLIYDNNYRIQSHDGLQVKINSGGDHHE